MGDFQRLKVATMPTHIEQDDFWQEVPPLKQGLGNHLR
jgi:hypothetical protein